MPTFLAYLQVLLAALNVAPPQASVRPLFDERHNIVCTVSSINERIGLWLTAQHCKGVRFVGQPAGDGTWHYHAVRPLYTNDEADIAVLFTDTLRVVALRFADHEPVVDDPVTMMGYPLGYEAMQRFHGTISNTSTPIVDHVLDPFTGEVTDVDYGVSMTYAMPACGGNSGSAVLNADGQVVGMLRLGFSSGCSAVTAGPTYRALNSLIGKFFER